MCFNTLSKPKTRISTNPAGLANFLLYPLCCRLLQSSSIHPPFPLHTMCVSWDTARLPTPGGCSHTNTLPHSAPGTAGARRWHGRTQAHVMPGTALLLLCPCRAAGPSSPEWAGAGQELSPGLGREQWVSCLRHWELSCARTAGVELGCAGFSCAAVLHEQLRDLSQTKSIWSKGPGWVFLPVRPTHPPAQALLLCLPGTAASTACCSAPKLAQSIAKLALLGVECFLTCCLPQIYIYFRNFQK